jgi:hypothetical protein
MPFEGDGVDVIRANISTPTPPMGIRVPFLEVDPLLEAFTGRLMAKKAAQRPATANDALQLLDLIGRDRTAAALSLGVDPQIARALIGSRPAIDTAESSPHPRVELTDSMPVLTEEMEPIEPEPLATKTPVPMTQPIAVPIEVARPWRSRRVWVIAGATATIISVFAIGFAMRGDSNERVTARDADLVAASTPAAPTPTAPLPTPLPTTRTPGAPLPAAPTASIPVEPPPEPPRAEPPKAEPPKIEPVPARPPPTKRVPPKPQPAKAEPAKADPTARNVADLYVQAGRELKIYGERSGPKFDELRARYRKIQINEAMTSDATRRDAMQQLAAIRSEMAKSK